jgi:hypothetical protein
MLLTDDYPHPIPTKAYLRWRENWFFLMLDFEKDIYCIAHMSVQPTFKQARFSFNLSVRGSIQLFSAEAAAPDDFENLKSVQVGPLSFSFLAPHRRFEVQFKNSEIEFSASLTGRMHTYDYTASAIANPDSYNTAEMVSAGGHDFWHQNQLLVHDAQLLIKAGAATGERIELRGPAYRDHSWGMRNDLGSLSHTWGFMIFKERVFHAKSTSNVRRPESWTREGYTGTVEGNVPLKSDLRIEYLGDLGDGVPETIKIHMHDSLGDSYTVVNDIKGARTRIALVTQAGGGKQYLMYENVCECVWEETGEKGVAVMEIGRLRSMATDQ